MAVVLVASAGLVAWDRLGATPADAEPTRSASGSEPAALPEPTTARAGTPTRTAPVRIAALASRTPYRQALEADAALAVAAAQAAPPAAAPPASAVPEPPAPPPYRVIGKGRVAGAWEVYLAQADHVVVARDGDRLDAQYQVVSIAPPAMQLMFLPTRESRTLTIGPAFDESPSRCEPASRLPPC